jgi:adenylate cyclase
MPNEIELKLLPAAEDLLRLQRHPLLRAAPRQAQMLDNWYYDTPELALRRHGIALRLRRQGRQRLQTIKLASKALPAAGLSIRPEWETPYSGKFDFSIIGIADTVAWLQQPSIAPRIVPLFRTHFKRVTWTLPLEGEARVLVALDRGTVTCGNASVPICELELELAGSEDAAALQRIAAQLGERVRLVPSDVSKAQRGYDLLAAQAKSGAH